MQALHRTDLSQLPFSSKTCAAFDAKIFIDGSDIGQRPTEVAASAGIAEGFPFLVMRIRS